MLVDVVAVEVVQVITVQVVAVAIVGHGFVTTAGDMAVAGLDVVTAAGAVGGISRADSDFMLVDVVIVDVVQMPVVQVVGMPLVGHRDVPASTGMDVRMLLVCCVVGQFMTPSRVGSPAMFIDLAMVLVSAIADGSVAVDGADGLHI